jgi:hypothetical protein
MGDPIVPDFHGRIAGEAALQAFAKKGANGGRTRDRTLSLARMKTSGAPIWLPATARHKNGPADCILQIPDQGIHDLKEL